MFSRLIAKISRVSYRVRTARQSKKPAIHPSFLDDFGA
jgi:hypothetical protein